MSDLEQLWITVEEPIKGARETFDTGGGFGTVAEQVGGLFKRRVPVDALALKSQMNGLLNVVGDLFDEAEQQTGMQLTEVTLSVEINGEGKVSLVGTGGTLGNKGGITLKFTRS
ncbi:MAG: Pepco domain-containing protein [Microcoleaceae cyanobacterium]